MHQPSLRRVLCRPSLDASARVRASPLAKRIASQRGLDLLSLKGTGPYGRILVRDLDAALAPVSALAPEQGTSVARHSQQGSQQPVNGPREDASDTTHALLAKNAFQNPKTLRSGKWTATVPQFSLSTDVVLDNLLDLQDRLNALASRDTGTSCNWQVSLDGLVIKAVALAMEKYPSVIVSWTGDAVSTHQHAGVGIVVQKAGGLTVPVIHRAASKGLAQLSEEAGAFSRQALNPQMPNEEPERIAVAIFKMFRSGIGQFTALVEPPFTSVLALGAVEYRPKIIHGEISSAPQMTMTLSADVRCINEELGGDFLLAIKSYLEEPGLMLV